MKKRAIIISSIVGAVILSGTVLFATLFGNNQVTEASNVVAEVNGEKIYVAEIEAQKSWNKLSLSNAELTIKDLGVSENDKEILLAQMKEYCEKTDEEILDEFVKSKVMVQEAKKLGLTVDETQASNESKETFNLCKDLALSENATESDKSNYKFITEYMIANNLTEAEYLEKAADSYINISYKNALEQHYVSNVAKESENTKTFESYVQFLQDKSSIKKYDF